MPATLYVEVTRAEKNLVTELGASDGDVFQVQNLSDLVNPNTVVHFEERDATGDRVGPGAKIHPGQSPYEYEVDEDNPAFVWVGASSPKIMLALIPEP